MLIAITKKDDGEENSFEEGDGTLTTAESQERISPDPQYKADHQTCVM